MNPVVVHNLLSINDEMTFVGISPEQAVVAAYEQSRGNFNTHDYPSPENHPQFRECTVSVSCGDFSALKDLTEQQLKAGILQLRQRSKKIASMDFSLQN